MPYIGLYIATILIWGASWYAVRLQLDMVAPEVSIFYRFLIATLIMFAICLASRRKLSYRLRDHCYFLLMGIFLFMLNFWLIYYASTQLTTGVVAVVFSTVLIFNMTNGRWIVGERVTAKMVVGALTGITGITLIFSPEIKSLDLSDQGLSGLLLALAGTLSASFGMTLSGLIQKNGLPVLQSNTWGMLYGSLVMLAIILIFDIPFSIDTSPGYLGSLAYLALFASVLGFYCFLSLVGRIGASKASYATVMFPVVALAISTWLEGYQWTTIAVAGLALTLFGNVLILDKKLPLMSKKLKPGH
jgi:drug/metabolite transporter (DMT)-like permease